jgi:hypothetical protein
MKSEEEVLMAASEAAIASPEGVAELWLLRERLNAEGRTVAVHACSDLIVGCSIDHRVDLVRAEELARALVQQLPDHRHFMLLAGVLQALGKVDEAAQNRIVANQTENLHPQAPKDVREKLMAEAIAAVADGKKSTTN